MLSLQGPTRLFLELMDLFKYLGHDVWIVGRTKRATVWKTKVGVNSERLKSKHYALKNLGDYHPLKYVDYLKDITLAELPLMYPYNYMPKALETTIPKMDLVVVDSEIYLPLSKFIPGNYLFYVHWPPQPFRNRKPLMPEAPAKIWVNSEYTAGEVRRLWGPLWDKEWPPLDPQVVYPPLWTSFYGGTAGFSDRPYDVVMFSRLYDDKIKFLEDLKDYKVVLIGSDYGLKNIPKTVKVWKNAPLKKVIEVLNQSKIYVHCKGLGTLENGAPSLPEHFGQTITEGMACGCVPIVPDVGGPVEIVGANQDYGYLFNSVGELKWKIQSLLIDEDLWTDYHERALARVKDFDVTNIAKKVGKLLGGE